jgi:glycosyltransferase involved in cell wall biosynthesis
VLDSASDDNALWKKDDQFEGKWDMVHRSRDLRNVVLTFLMKNELGNIERAIESAHHLADCVLIHDTGSTDDSIQAALDTGDKLGIAVTVKEVEWVNFGYNRAQLMSDAADYGDYQLLMDADEELINAPDAWPELCADAYYLHYDGELDYAQMRLVRSAVEWSWFDPVHSWLGTDGNYTEIHLRAPLIKHYGEEEDFSEARLQRDLDKILPLLDENPLDARSVFNLAKTLDGLGRKEEAKEAFRTRVEMEGWDEEKWYARYRLGRLTAVDDFDAGAQLLLDAWRERPWRIEPLRALAAFATMAADLCPYPYEDSLFVQRSHYKEG